MRLRQYISDYQNWCMVRYLIVLPENRTQTNSIIQKVSKKYDKDFDFFKQHASSHVVADIEQRGCTYNFSTRPGEGFQQEAAQAYKTTNRKKTEHQVGFNMRVSSVNADNRTRCRVMMKLKKLLQQSGWPLTTTTLLTVSQQMLLPMISALPVTKLLMKSSLQSPPRYTSIGGWVRPTT